MTSSPNNKSQELGKETDDPSVAEKNLVDLLAILNKRAIAYKGKVHDNVVNAFDEFGLENQKKLLRGLIVLHTVLQSSSVFSAKYTDLDEIPGQDVPAAPPPPGTKAVVEETISRREAVYWITLFIAIALVLTVVMVSDDPYSIGYLENILSFSTAFIGVFSMF